MRNFLSASTKKAAANCSEARERLLAAATELFHAEGIDTVGVDRIVAAASVTLATVYRHFPSKEDLHRAFTKAGHERPSNAARHFVMLRDGAVSAAYLDSKTAARRNFKRGVEGLVRSIDLEAPAGREEF
jgi:AcrR family transcriptional regulator